MLRKTLLALTLCSLPLMADSISFTGSSDWNSLHGVTAAGTDSLNYSQSAYEYGMPIATVSTNDKISQTGGVYNLTGSLSASQGYPLPIPGGQFYAGETGARLILTLDAAADSGNFLIAGVDHETNDDGYGTGIPSCQLLLTGGTASGSCNSPTFALMVDHTPGTPISLGFEFGNFVQSFGSTYTEDFGISVTDPAPVADTPEPGTLVLFGLPLLAFAIARRRTARVTR